MLFNSLKSSYVLFSMLFTNVSLIIAITRFIMIKEMKIGVKKCKTNWKVMSLSTGKSAGKDIEVLTGNSTLSLY